MESASTTQQSLLLLTYSNSIFSFLSVLCLSSDPHAPSTLVPDFLVSFATFYIHVGLDESIMADVTFAVTPATPQKRSYEGDSKSYSQDPTDLSATRSAAAVSVPTSRQGSPAPSSDSSLTELTASHYTPGSAAKPSGTPAAKKRKLTFIEKQAEQAAKKREKEEKARQKAEEKARKDEEKTRKDEEKRLAAEEKEASRRAKDLEKAEKQKVKDEEKAKKDAEKAAKEKEKKDKEDEKEREKLKKERVSWLLYAEFYANK